MKTRDKFSFIRYSNCWEDSGILLQALQIREGEVGLSVASGGDNTFALLLSDPKKICAFDLNKTQLYLMKLKMAAIESLTYEEALGFLGVTESADRLRRFFALRESLDEETYRYFDQRRDLIQSGVVHAGKFERYFQIFRKFICPLFCREEKLHEFCDLSSPKEQKAFYETCINNRRFRLIFRIFFGVKVMGTLGRDRSFYQHVEEKEDVGGDIKKRFELGIAHSENRTNPYLSYILRGNFTETSLPLYLKREYFYLIRDRLSRISFFHGRLMDVPEREQFDFFNLSDIFEYLSEEDFRENVKKLEKISKSEARVVLWNMQNRRYLPKESFALMEKESRDCFDRSQSYFYRDFSVYRKRKR